MPVGDHIEADMGRPEKRKPGAASSHTWFPWLRDRLHTSNYILVKIPIEIHDLGHGEMSTCMDCERLPEELGLSDLDIESLSKRGLVRVRPKKPLPRNAKDTQP